MISDARIQREAERESFKTVSETCPTVDDALSVAAGKIKEQTGVLREALVEALVRAISAEWEVEDLRSQVENLEERLRDAQQESAL